MLLSAHGAGRASSRMLDENLGWQLISASLFCVRIGGQWPSPALSRKHRAGNSVPFFLAIIVGGAVQVLNCGHFAFSSVALMLGAGSVYGAAAWRPARKSGRRGIFGEIIALIKHLIIVRQNGARKCCGTTRPAWYNAPIGKARIRRGIRQRRISASCTQGALLKSRSTNSEIDTT